MSKPLAPGSGEPNGSPARKPRAQPHDHANADRRPPLAVTIHAACKATGVGPSTMYRLMREGQVRTVKVGRRRLILYRSLEALVASPPL